MKQEKHRKACLHMEVFRNLGIDEKELPNHAPYSPDDENLALAKELIEVARMLLERA